MWSLISVLFIVSCSKDGQDVINETDGEVLYDGVYPFFVEMEIKDITQQNTLKVVVASMDESQIDNYLLTHQLELIVHSDFTRRESVSEGQQNSTNRIERDEIPSVLIDQIEANFTSDIVGYSLRITKEGLNTKATQSLSQEDYKSPKRFIYGEVYHVDEEPSEFVNSWWAYTSCWLCSWHWEDEGNQLSSGEWEEYCKADEYRIKVAMVTEIHSDDIYVISFSRYCPY